MATFEKKQDMPPPGGYKSIPFERIPARTYFKGRTIIGMYLAATATGSYLYYLTWKRIREEEIEARSARLAIWPMLLAERDREYMKQLRRNRDEEAKLMANVEGWEVGTYYGQPIYKTAPNDKLIEPSFHEYYIHSAFKDFAERAYLKLWS